jgi:DNA primase catalytic core
MTSDRKIKMPQIPETEINRVKREISIIQLAESYDLKLKSQGKDYVTHCPWHNDKTPSLVFTPKTNLYHCMGACNVGGNVIQFVMKMDNLSFVNAYEKLISQSSSLAAKKTTSTTDTTQSTKIAISILETASQTAALSAIAFYHKGIHDSPPVLSYLQQRGLNHSKLLTQFKMGCVDRALSQQLPNRKSVEGKKARADLKRSGLLKASGHEFFTGCLVVPIFKLDGRLGEVYGRRLNTADPRLADHLYLPDRHQGVFNHAAINAHEPLILCESIIDALSFWVHDFRHVTASFGVNGFTEEMQACLDEKQVQSVLIAYDNDAAGNNAATQLAQRWLEQGKSVSRLLLPKGVDINAFMLSQKEPKQALQSLLDQHQSYQMPEPIETKTRQSVIDCQYDGTQAIIQCGDREYRLRGIERNRTIDQMKVQCRLKQGAVFFLDTLDLASNRQRQQFIKAAAEELNLNAEVIKRDVVKLLSRRMKQ